MIVHLLSTQLPFCPAYPLRVTCRSNSSVLVNNVKKLLREVCMHDEDLFSTFLNRLFNTLSWAMMEFSVSVREMQESYTVLFP